MSVVDLNLASEPIEPVFNAETVLPEVVEPKILHMGSPASNSPFAEDEAALADLESRKKDVQEFLDFVATHPETFDGADKAAVSHSLAKIVEKLATLRADLDERKKEYGGVYLTCKETFDRREQILDDFEKRTQVLSRNDLVEHFVSQQVKLKQMLEQIKARVVKNRVPK